MSHIVIDEQKCKGCLLCTVACPRQLIRNSGRANHQGYHVAELPEDRMAECTGCASCAVVCPDAAITVWRTGKAEAKEAAEESGNA